jgi:hypothetical protein
VFFPYNRFLVLYNVNVSTLVFNLPGGYPFYQWLPVSVPFVDTAWRYHSTFVIAKRMQSVTPTCNENTNYWIQRLCAMYYCPITKVFYLLSSALDWIAPNYPNLHSVHRHDRITRKRHRHRIWCIAWGGEQGSNATGIHHPGSLPLVVNEFRDIVACFVKIVHSCRFEL